MSMGKDLLDIQTINSPPPASEVANNEIILSIIIVNYNGKHFFNDCLRSIKEHVPFQHEIIIVDNGSSDDSVEFLRRYHPEVILIDSGRNLGFAKGNNLGARCAKGRYLLLLNNDTILLNDLKPLIKLIEKNNTIGIVGIRMLGKEREYRYSAGFFPEPWRLIKFSSLYKKRDEFRSGTFPDKDIVYQVDWVEGSFLFTPTELWQNLGGLDESYFMYVEDIDYAKRVFDSGKRVVYFPSLGYIHFGGYGASRIGMLINGFRRYHKSHSNFITRLLTNIILDIGLVLRAALFILRSIGNKQEIERAKLCLKALRRLD